MKKYISAILIPCLLLQLCGCYSFNEITIDELKNYKGSNEIRIKTHNREVLIERRTGILDPMEWESNDSLIIIKTKEQVKWGHYKKLEDRSSDIKLSEIETAEIEEFDLLKTSLLILTMGAIIAAGVAGSQLSGGIGMSAR
jgi:hypothetical protein